MAYHYTVDKYGQVVLQYNGAVVQPLNDGKWELAWRVAEDVLLDKDESDEMPITYFCNPDVGAKCSWHNKAFVQGRLEYAYTIGRHQFYIDTRPPEFGVITAASWKR